MCSCSGQGGGCAEKEEGAEDGGVENLSFKELDKGERGS